MNKQVVAVERFTFVRLGRHKISLFASIRCREGYVVKRFDAATNTVTVVEVFSRVERPKTSGLEGPAAEEERRARRVAENRLHESAVALVQRLAASNEDRPKKEETDGMSGVRTLRAARS